MTDLRIGSSVQPNVMIRIGGRTEHFVVDTGSARSGVTGSVVAAASLAAAGGRIQLTGLGCSFVAPLYNSGSWSVGGVGLQSQPLAEVTVAGGSDTIGGLLGSDALNHFPWIVLDYAGSRLLLGRST
jgi:Aspartyl protease